jgi:hypothetical protein
MTEATRQRANTAFMIGLAALVAATGTLTRSLRVQVGEWTADERRPRSRTARGDRALADPASSCTTQHERVDAKRAESAEIAWEAIVDTLPRAERRRRRAPLPDVALAWFVVADVELWADRPR